MDNNNNNLQNPTETTSVTVQNSTVFTNKKKVFIVIGAIIIILIPVITLFLVQNRHMQQNKLKHSSSAISSVSQSSIIRTDNWQEFSVAIPKNWQVSRSMQQGTTGLNTTHPVVHQTEITQFYIPGQTGITVQVDHGHPNCPLSQPLTTSFANLPASYDPAMNAWTIPTATAIITVSISYPGVGQFNPPMMHTAPTKVPQAKVANYQKTLNSVIKTFTFSNLKPFHC